MNSHPYFQYRNSEISEGLYYQALMHFSTKIDFGSMRRKTQQEKDELKTRMLAYPNKNHRPVSANNQ